jgi:HlyD family secretion protein
VNKRALRSRALRLALIAVALSLLVFWALQPSPVLVDIASAQRGSLIVTVDDEGETRVRDRYVVSAPVPGRMRRIELEPGDVVKARTTVLAMFEPADPGLLDARTRAEIEARVQAAESAVGSARAEQKRLVADLEYGQKELGRYRELAEAGLTPRDRLEAVERQVRTLEEALGAAEFAVRTAEYQLEVARASLLQGRGKGGPLIRLTSPIDGVVLRRLKESEAVVATGQPLIEVGNLAQLEIVADFLSTAAVRVRAGQKVLVEQWGGDKPLAARVRRVEPSGFMKISALGVEEQRVNVIVDFEGPSEHWQKLGDGYRVEVRVIVSEREDVVKVPTSSLFRHNGGWALFAVVNGIAVRRSVEIGEQNGLDAEIVSGIDAGDQVIVFPSDDVLDGVMVAPRASGGPE